MSSGATSNKTNVTAARLSGFAEGEEDEDEEEVR
jgi:hypothetical protein